MMHDTYSKDLLGKRVRVKPGVAHDKMTAGKSGTIQKVSTPALGIRFEGMEGLHKWYTAGELETSGNSRKTSSPKPSMKKGGMMVDSKVTTKDNLPRKSTSKTPKR